MVDDVAFTSYYGRPIVKAPPWKHEIGAYLFLGGVAGGSALLGLGGQLTDRPALRRNARLTALCAAGVGAVALIADLGRPERFLNMFRTFKVTSPMSLGSWILGAFSAAAAVPALLDAERLTRLRLPLPRLAAITAGNAAQRFGLSDRKGRIAKGLDADFAIVDPDAEWTLGLSDLKSSAGYSIYDGWRFKGRVVHTVSRGAFILRDGALIDDAIGRGRYLRRNPVLGSH